MQTPKRSVERIIEEQVQRWQISRTAPRAAPVPARVITISREPGSGGKIVAQGIADRLGLDLFHQEVIHEMAQSASVSTQVLETLDEKGLTVLEHWISSLVDSRHLWPDQYLQHLLKVVAAIGRHGEAVLVGRGANFILPPDRRFRVRIIAPQPIRIQNVSREFGVSEDEARARILQTESDRRAFIRKYFHADIDDPLNYDLVVNTDTLGIDEAVDAVCGVIDRCMAR